VFAELKDRVRRKIERYGLARVIEARHLFPTVEAAVEGFAATTGITWADAAAGTATDAGQAPEATAAAGKTEAAGAAPLHEPRAHPSGTSSEQRGSTRPT
jgi:hypothetical protein